MYAVSRYEVTMQAATGEQRLDFTSTGDKAFWSPGFVPHIIRAWSVVLDATPGDAGEIALDLRPTRDSDTNRAEFGNIVLATTHTVTAGSLQTVVYESGLSQVVYPGQEVVCEAVGASASVDEALVVLWVEPVYQSPANVTTLSTSTSMVATT